MKEKEIPTIQRATLLKTISEKNLSENCNEKISKIIKNVSESKGHNETEMMAQKILETIETIDNEAEIMKILNNL